MASTLILATATNKGYYERAKPYLESILSHSNADENVYLTMDFKLSSNHPKLRYDYVDCSRGLRAPINNWCIQHGEFIDYIPCEPDDVILFTDADLKMQRPFLQSELDQLQDLGQGDVFLGYNAGPKDTLRNEAERLGLTIPMQQLEEEFGDLSLPCYNVGCVAATRSTWAVLCEMYVERFPTFFPKMTHVARQQWLISWLIGKYLKPIEMPTSFHAHNHYGVPAGCSHKDGKTKCNGELVLFSHKFDR